MARLTLNNTRKTETKNEHIGKVLIFCEGYTEYNYFNYLCEYYNTNKKDKYSQVELIPVNTEGNASNVLNYADDFFEKDGNKEKYSNHEKHLVFDCDAPDNIQEVINNMKNSPNDYFLDYTCLVFETWLLMHYQEFSSETKYRKSKLYNMMCDILDVNKYTSKVKASEATIKKILASDGREKMKKAIVNAQELEKYYKDAGLYIFENIKDMNPSSSVHSLVERIIDEIDSYCK